MVELTNKKQRKARKSRSMVVVNSQKADIEANLMNKIGKTPQIKYEAFDQMTKRRKLMFITNRFKNRTTFTSISKRNLKGKLKKMSQL